MHYSRLVLLLLAIVAIVFLRNPTHAQDVPACETISRDDTVNVAPLEALNVGQTVVDPTFCTPITRATDASANGGFATHEYSQLQAFSPAEDYILLLGAEGYRVHRLADLTQIELDTVGWNAARWYDPQRIIHYDDNGNGTIAVQLTDVTMNSTETIFTFPDAYNVVNVARSSDELSRDSRWLAGVVQRQDGEWVAFALDLLDITAPTLTAEIPLNALYDTGACPADPEWGNVMPDWVGVSPLGNYLMIQWVRDGNQRCSGLESFMLNGGAFVGRAYDGHQHGDLGITEDGREFFMTFEIYHPSGNLAIGVRALPGGETASEPDYINVLDWGNGEHISCQGLAGVCLVTAGMLPDNGWNPLEGELFLQYVDGRVERLVHHRSSSCGYWVQPRASLSPSGTLAVFASDWGNQQACNDLGRGDAYIIELN